MFQRTPALCVMVFASTLSRFGRGVHALSNSPLFVKSHCRRQTLSVSGSDSLFHQRLKPWSHQPFSKRQTRRIFSVNDDVVGGVQVGTKNVTESGSTLANLAENNSSSFSLVNGMQENGLGKPVVVTEDETAAESTSILAIDPSTLAIEVKEPDHKEHPNDGKRIPPNVRGPGFVKMFRGSANYIANHRSTLAVYHIPGALLDSWGEGTFRDLMDDIALTWLLGMKVLIVAGCRHQVDRRMDNKRERHFGMSVTDEETLRIVKEEAGYVRFEVERQLARSLRLHGGLSSKSASFDGNVVSGNFYSAQPFGVLEGIDYKYTGFVRRVEVEKIRDVHQSRDICLLTTLGVSPSGEVFNVNSESLAATVAGAMEASKIVFFTEKEMVLRNTRNNKLVQNMRLSDVQNLLEYNGVDINARGFANVKGSNNNGGMFDTTNGDAKGNSDQVEMLLKLGWAMAAVERGVKRAHIITPTRGALLQELYTRDGSGTLISRDLYEGIRRANVHDVVGISDLIQPLIQMGTLVDRPKSQLEKDIDSYFVYTRDSLIVACGQLKRFENGFAEIGCLVVSKEYRKGGRGDAMLGYLERMCVQSGATKVFVLSTQTMEWFLERGFQEVSVDSLPPSRQKTYNHERNSKIYMKEIHGDRDLDAAELWWNR